MNAAFSQDVLEERYNSEVIELDNDRRMVLRVAEHRETSVLPLEQVREQAQAAVRARKQQQALMDEAQELLADPESYAIDWREANSISREADTTVPRMIVQAAFRMPHPENDESTYRSVELPEGVAIIALDDVRDGDVDEQTERFVAQMAEQLRAQSVIQGLIDDLRSDADVERR